MRRFAHSAVCDHTAVETPISQAKHWKRWVSPEQVDDDDVSSVTSVDDSVSEVSQDDDHVFRVEGSLRLRCLNLLHDKEEASLMNQARLRDNVCNPPSHPNRHMRNHAHLLSVEKLKCRISKVLALLLQSQSIFGRLQEEQTRKALLLVEQFIEHDWDDATDIYLSKFYMILQRSVPCPPHIVVVVSRTTMQPQATGTSICGGHSPKKLCFDTMYLSQQQRRRRRELIDRSQGELQRLSLMTKDLLHRRLAAPLDDEITDKLDAVEARTDILDLWRDLIQRQWGIPTDEALELFQDTLDPTVSVEKALWNFVYYVSLNDEP